MPKTMPPVFCMKTSQKYLLLVKRKSFEARLKLHMGTLPAAEPAPVEVEDSVRAPLPPSPELLRDYYFRATERLFGGIIRYRDRALKFGPLNLISFGEPARSQDGWSFPLTGGALVRRPGGSLDLEWSEGTARATVHGYLPRLPPALYSAVQLRVHHLLSRLVLLGLRGRLPAPAVPAAPLARLAAGALDAGLCLALARGRPARALAVAAVYHVACWVLPGQTLGGRLLSQRVVAVDGSSVTPGQAVIRLLALPAALIRLRAVHDELAGTEVVRP